MKKGFFSVLFVMGLVISGAAQIQHPEQFKAISIEQIGQAYTQDFNKKNADGLQAANGLLDQVPNGWAFSEDGIYGTVQLDGQYRAGNGVSKVPDTYSFGTSFSSTDRAFGAVTSTRLKDVKIGAFFVNATGKKITSLAIEYVGEQWRNSGFGKPAKLRFSYSTNAASLDEGDWIDVEEFDFVAPIVSSDAGNLDGNDQTNRKVLKHTIKGLSIENNASFVIRWHNNFEHSDGNGLAIDDVRVVASDK